jgi:hypothetical protein
MVIMHTLDKKACVSRILAVYGRALPNEKAEGLVWYDLANTFCQGLAKKYKLSVDQAAGITAALSPQVSWKENQRLAETMAKTGKCGALGNNERKARAIRNFRPVLETLTTETSPHTGQKVRAFYACIADPANATAVCVDRHAFAILLGNLDAKVADLQPLGRRGVYEQAEACYQEAARLLGIKPWQVQATTWVVWRNLKQSLQIPLFGGLGHDADWSEGFAADAAKAVKK